MAAMASAAIAGGAVGIRADGVADVTAIRAAIGPKFRSWASSKSSSRTARSSSRRLPKVLGRSSRRAPSWWRSTGRPGHGRVVNSLRDVVSAIHAAGGAALADVGTIEDARYADRVRSRCGRDDVERLHAGQPKRARVPISCSSSGWPATAPYRCLPRGESGRGRRRARRSNSARRSSSSEPRSRIQQRSRRGLLRHCADSPGLAVQWRDSLRCTGVSVTLG